MDSGARCRAAGIALGAGAAFALTRTYLFGFAPVILALCLAAGVLAGAAVAPRPARQRGMASLRTRRVRDYVPVFALLVGAAFAVGVSVAAFAPFPTPERPDHQSEYFAVFSPASLISTLATMGVAALVAGLAVWAVVHSPQAAVDNEGAAADEIWRRATVHTIVHACTGLFATILTAIAFWYADAQMDWRGGGSPPLGVALSLLGGLGLVAMARYLGTLVLPRTATPSDSPARAGSPALATAGK
jgi:hypothetical protein